MKTITLSCDGCSMQAPGNDGQLPADWCEVSSSGWALGVFCAKCAKSVNVPKMIEKQRAAYEAARSAPTPGGLSEG